MKKNSIFLFCFFLSLTLFAQNYQANWQSLDSRPIPGWFTNAKFGIFIHWGVYSVPAFGPTDAENIYAKYSEWYWKRLSDSTMPGHGAFKQFHESTFGDAKKYQDFAPEFKAEMYDPEFWAETFKNAGAKYVVMVSKHHDGFAMWPSKYSWNWNAGDIGPHRDLAGDLVKAVRSKGLRMGFYYSLYEWFNPVYHENVDTYVEQHMLPQMKELVNHFEPDIFWPDGEWDYPHTTWKATDFLSWLYNDSPVKEKVVVNDRWGKATRSKHGSFFTTEYGLVHEDEGALGEDLKPWEECRGIGGSFGYNRAENLTHYSSSYDLIKVLARTVSQGGNLLLNIGPTADGRIPVIMQQRLKDMGDWLSVNGEAIYDTRAWRPMLGKADGNTFYTTKGKDLYLIVMGWPEQRLLVPISSQPAKVQLLGSTAKVDFDYQKGKLSIRPPAISPGQAPCQHAYVFKIADVIK